MKKQKNKKKWNINLMPRLDGKIFIITGANSGLGFETTRQAVKAGAHVVMACRNKQRADKAIERIHAETPRASVEFMELDLADLETVRAFASRAADKLPGIDVLCNNGGRMVFNYAENSHTKDGFEVHFGTNHLGHFALTGLLFPKMRKAARIVTVSSLAHKMGAEIPFGNLLATAPDAFKGYGNSKLANLLFTYELDRRIRKLGLDMKAVACHPGFARTGTNNAQSWKARSGSVWQRKLLLRLAQSAEMGALPEIYAATGEDIESGDYIGPTGWMELGGLPGKVRSSRLSHDILTAEKLWQISGELTGMHFLEQGR